MIRKQDALNIHKRVFIFIFPQRIFKLKNNFVNMNNSHNLLIQTHKWGNKKKEKTKFKL